MQVNATGNEYRPPGDQPGAVTKSLDKDAFLRLLVEQLKNQDPMNPQDSGEFIAQLTTFSSLEQLTNLNNEVQRMKRCLDMMQASTLIGKRVEIQTREDTISGIVDKVAVDAGAVKVFVDGAQYGVDTITLIEAEAPVAGNQEQSGRFADETPAGINDTSPAANDRDSSRGGVIW